MFARHFMSEGITHGHVVVGVGERVSSWLDNLPKPIEQNTGKVGTNQMNKFRYCF